MTVYQNDRDDPNYVFTYDETSKSCLRWKNPRRNSTLVGKEAGTPTTYGNWAARFRGMPVQTHRIIWEMFKGPFKHKNDIIRFKDGDVGNPRIQNLILEEYEGKNWQDIHLKNRDWRKVFTYSHGKLYWIGDRWSGSYLNKLTASDQQEIQTHPDKDGYLKIKINVCGSNELRLQRLIYEWHYGEIPEGMVVDHEDGDILNNKIENLRCVSTQTNARNTRISSRNQTGVLGVRIREREDSKVYIAIWRDDNKAREKSFSVNKYGEQQAFQLACDYRDKMIAKLNEKLGDEGYHENHGRR